MSKRAETRVPVLDAIADRWSPRAYKPDPVPKETLLAVLEAARWAASSFNEQPWRFIVGVKGEGETYERIASCLVEFNRSWASAAPVLMLAVAGESFAKNGKPNRHAMHDVGQALANLSVQAAACGVQVHQMAGFDPDAARSTFSLPVGWVAATALSLGYEGDPAGLPEQMQEGERAPRQRKPLSDIVFDGTWGTPSPLVE